MNEYILRSGGKETGVGTFANDRQAWERLRVALPNCEATLYCMVKTRSERNPADLVPTYKHDWTKWPEGPTLYIPVMNGSTTDNWAFKESQRRIMYRDFQPRFIPFWPILGALIGGMLGAFLLKLVF